MVVKDIIQISGKEINRLFQLSFLITGHNLSKKKDERLDHLIRDGFEDIFWPYSIFCALSSILLFNGAVNDRLDLSGSDVLRLVSVMGSWLAFSLFIFLASRFFGGLASFDDVVTVTVPILSTCSIIGCISGLIYFNVISEHYLIQRVNSNILNNKSEMFVWVFVLFQIFGIVFLLIPALRVMNEFSWLKSVFIFAMVPIVIGGTNIINAIARPAEPPVFLPQISFGIDRGTPFVDPMRPPQHIQSSTIDPNVFNPPTQPPLPVPPQLSPFYCEKTAVNC